jgi:hypothetical protein
MGKWPGVGERITRCLHAAGYWKNDKPDVMRFSMERGIPVPYLYKWLKDVTPDRPYLLKLAKEFKVAPAWLLLGDDYGVSQVSGPPTKRGHRKLRCLVGALLAVGSLGRTLPAEARMTLAWVRPDSNLTALPLIRSALRRLLGALWRHSECGRLPQRGDFAWSAAVV